MCKLIRVGWSVGLHITECEKCSASSVAAVRLMATVPNPFCPVYQHSISTQLNTALMWMLRSGDVSWQHAFWSSTLPIRAVRMHHPSTLALAHCIPTQAHSLWKTAQPTQQQGS